MTVVHLPADFAAQSSLLTVAQRLEQATALAALIEAANYPRAGTIQLDGLRPSRHYHLRGATQRFVRSDDRGTVELDLVLTGPTLLLLSPVV